MDLVTATGLSKRYGGIVALSEAEFTARAGEVHALLGENGAGKSTFIQILSGAIRHDGGSILVDGQEFRPANPDEAQRARHRRRVPGTVAHPRPHRRGEHLVPPRADDAAGAPSTARRCGGRRRNCSTATPSRRLRPDQELRRLTLAERQIVEIAKGLAKNPRILILDEATSALPAREADWLLKLTRQLAGEGRLVIFISHRMAEVRAIADRLTIFRNGRTVAAHEANAVSDGEIVSQMIGRNLDRLYPERISTATDRIALKVTDFASGSRLSGVSFSLREGEVLGVGGLQGHGQRELFQALFGAARATGSLELWGKPASINNPRAALTGRDGIALVPEDRRGQGLLLTKSVRENLTLAVIKRFTDKGFLNSAKEAALVKEMVDFLRIKADTPDQLAGTLSGGNQQKVIFGKMLLTEARVLLLYDPTRGVDVGTKGEIFQLMRDLAAKGYAILFHSSDMPELVHVADRVLVMRNGRVAATLDGERISEENILGAAMLDVEAA